jgi:hypothetical protein
VYIERKPAKPTSTIKIASYFLIFIAVYLAIMVTGIYQNKKSINKEVERQLGFAEINQDSFIVQQIMTVADRENIPLNEKDITINRDDDKIKIDVIYRDELKFFGAVVSNYRFNISAVKVTRE